MLCGACAKAAAEATATGRGKVWEELPGCFELPAWGVVGLLVLESMIRASNVYIHGMFLELERKDRNAWKPRSHLASRKLLTRLAHAAHVQIDEIDRSDCNIQAFIHCSQVCWMIVAYVYD
jgi:hypothetical protein